MKIEDNTVYIAGKITDDPDYKMKFERVAAELTAAGCLVMCPSVLPWGFPHEAYMGICAEMLKACAQVCFLPDWRESKGAIQEMGLAVALEKSIFYYEDWRNSRQQEDNVEGCADAED